VIDKHVLDAIGQVARERDTPDVVVEAVVRRLMPSIRLVPQPAKAAGEERMGGCRIGGVPDLPAKVAWPRLSTAWHEDLTDAEFPDEALPFLLQVNLAEVAPLDVESVLPRSGMLYFFYQTTVHEDHFDPDAELPFILFAPDVAAGLYRPEMPADIPSNQRYRGHELLPCLEWTVPSPADSGLDEAVFNEHLRFWDELEETVAAAQGLEHARGPAPAHRMLGHPQLIQSPGLADGTRLLLQVDSDVGRRWPKTGMIWGDGGRVYYLIGEDELRAHNFSKPWAIMEMC
jgi:uncharacterized protein YwqG